MPEPGNINETVRHRRKSPNYPSKFFKLHHFTETNLVILTKARPILVQISHHYLFIRPRLFLFESFLRLLYYQPVDISIKVQILKKPPKTRVHSIGRTLKKKKA